MTYPTGYDAEGDAWTLAGELVVLTLNGAIQSTDATIVFNETDEVDDLTTPTYLTFETETTSGDFEIVKITSKGSAGSGIVNVDRGALSSVAMYHASGTVAVQDPVSIHLSTIRSLLLGVEKFHGLVGLESALPATCSPGEIYIATDSSKVFQAVDTNTWRQLTNLDHGTLTGLGDDDHTDLHTDTRKDTWHTALGGDHITKAAHVHDGVSGEGEPIERVEYGLYSAMPATPGNGQCYWCTDTYDLYVGNGGSWVRYVVMPENAIVWFPGACPPGWTRLAAADEKFFRGAPAGVWGSFTDGGYGTHYHSLPDVITHSHNIASQSGSSTSAGAHGHSFDASNYSGSNTEPYDQDLYTFDGLSFGHSSHQHNIEFTAHDTDDSGGNPANSGATSSLPAWINLVACEKD